MIDSPALMAIDRAEVLRIAQLARLALADEEADALTKQLGTILEYVEQLGELETAGIPPTSHIEMPATPMRPDEPRPCLPREEALKNAPQATEEFFVVPRILGDAGE